MTIKDFKLKFFTELKSLFPETEIQSFFYLLFQFKLNLSKVELALNPNLEINDEDLTFLNKAVQQLKKYVPIQYILGETIFFDLPFNVNKNVLIPRPETEELVDWILKDATLKKNLNLLDIGTGSGCIAISLAKNLPDAAVFALDVSENALSVAKENATLNSAHIKFLKANVLKLDKLPQQYDIIVSNPPYVRELEREQMQQNVLAYEPHLALFVKDTNPLLFYDKIAELAKNHLSQNGNLYFEINQYLAKATKELLVAKGFTQIETKKDIFGVDRMLKCSI